MVSHASDEEQIEALKRWWKENGSSLLTGVIVVLAAYFGFGQFERMRESEAGQASALYQQISELALANLSAPISEDDLLAAQSLYSQLKNDYADSIYARYAALVMARFQIENDEPALAEAELQWILDNRSLKFLQEADEELFIITRLRLARIQLAQGEPALALATLQAEPVPAAFRAVAAELEGDVHMAMGERDAARAAYQEAFAEQTALATGSPTVLLLKLQELGVNPTDMQ